MHLCVACGVEREDPLPVFCPICTDERQYVPESGQEWRSIDEMRLAGYRLNVHRYETGLFGLTVEPTFAIGQTALLVVTPAGSVLWDPPPYIDDAAVASVREHGEVLAIAASHPHMFGAQLEWSRALGGVPVLVNAADAEWIGRQGPEIVHWSNEYVVAPGLTLYQVGGHFPGSAAALWRAGAAGRGALLASDTIFPNPDRKSVTFMRSLPNRLPLSHHVVARIADTVNAWEFDRVYGNVSNIIDRDGKRVIAESAARQIAWSRGDYDHLS